MKIIKIQYAFQFRIHYIIWPFLYYLLTFLSYHWLYGCLCVHLKGDRPLFTPIFNGEVRTVGERYLLNIQYYQLICSNVIIAVCFFLHPGKIRKIKWTVTCTQVQTRLRCRFSVTNVIETILLIYTQRHVTVPESGGNFVRGTDSVWGSIFVDRGKKGGGGRQKSLTVKTNGFREATLLLLHFVCFHDNNYSFFYIFHPIKVWWQTKTIPALPPSSKWVGRRTCPLEMPLLQQ